MAKKSKGGGVYRIVDVVGVSKTSWEDAGRRAVENAATSLRDLRVAEVTKMDMTVDNGKVSAFRTRVALSFNNVLSGRTRNATSRWNCTTTRSARIGVQYFAKNAWWPVDFGVLQVAGRIVEPHR